MNNPPILDRDEVKQLMRQWYFSITSNNEHRWTVRFRRRVQNTEVMLSDFSISWGNPLSPEETKVDGKVNIIDLNCKSLGTSRKQTSKTALMRSLKSPAWLGGPSSEGRAYVAQEAIEIATVHDYTAFRWYTADIVNRSADLHPFVAFD